MYCSELHWTELSWAEPYNHCRNSCEMISIDIIGIDKQAVFFVVVRSGGVLLFVPSKGHKWHVVKWKIMLCSLDSFHIRTEWNRTERNTIYQWWLMKRTFIFPPSHLVHTYLYLVYNFVSYFQPLQGFNVQIIFFCQCDRWFPKLRNTSIQLYASN